MDSILEVKNLTVEFETERGVLRACDDVSIDIYRGEIVGIIGESGSGKTTLASGILQSVQPPGRIVQGQVLYHPKNGGTVDLLKLSEEEYAKYRWTNITTVFQAAQNVLNPALRIRDHFIETVRAHDPRAEKGRILEKAADLLKQVRLEERVLDSYPHQLSGGMKQRAIIALSLILQPSLLILDEPTTALDVITQWYIMDILRKVHNDTGITMIFMTHDVSIIGSIVDRIGVMYAAKMVEYGPVRKVFNSPSHAYTRCLMRAIPSMHDDVRKREAISGYPPNLLELPKGCRFGPRCPLVRDKKCQPEDFDMEQMVAVDGEQLSLCTQWKQVKQSVID